MATYRKRNGKWQAIVRHKEIGTRAGSFHTKQAAIKWATDEERMITEGELGVMKPSKVTLGQLLQRYVADVLPPKRGAVTEGQRLQRLVRDPVSGLRASQLTSQAIAAFRDRRLLDGRRTCHYDLILIRHCLKIAMNEWGLMLSANPVDRVKMPLRHQREIGDWKTASSTGWKKHLIRQRTHTFGLSSSSPLRQG